MYLVTTASSQGDYGQSFYVLGLFDTLDECAKAIEDVKAVLKSYNTIEVTKFLKDLDDYPEWYDDFFKIMEVESGLTYSIPFEIDHKECFFFTKEGTKYIGSYAE